MNDLIIKAGVKAPAFFFAFESPFQSSRRKLVMVIYLLLCLALSTPVVLAGRVETSDHRTFEGRIDFQQDGRLVVVGANGQREQLALSQVLLARINPRLTQSNSLPKGWHTEQIGGASGEVVVRDGAFEMDMTGSSAKEPVPSAQFVFRRVRSDPEIVARLASLTGPASSSAGLMLRAQLTPAGALALLSVTPDQQLLWETRRSRGSNSKRYELGKVTLPLWLKLDQQERGRTVVAYHSADGRNWEQVGQIRLECETEPFPEDSTDWRPKVFAGLAITSTATNAACAARLDHVSLKVAGLLGEYFGDEQFRDLRFVRPDHKVEYWWGDKPPGPDMSPGRFSIRWTGQVTPKYSEPYRFHFEADDAARLWIDGQELPPAKLLDRKERYETIKQLMLAAGRSYDLRFEFMNEEGPALVRLGWSSPSQRVQVVPQSQLSYTYTPGSRDEENEGAITNILHLKGIYLRDGSFIAGEVLAGDTTATQIEFADQRRLSVLTAKIARVVFRNIRRPFRFERVDNQTGVFIKNGDFLESEFIEVKNSFLTVSSVLFGRRTYSTRSSETAALVLNRYALAPAPLEVRLLDGSVLRAKGIRPAEGKILVDDVTLGPVSVAQSELMELRNLAPPDGGPRTRKSAQAADARGRGGEPH